MCGIIGVLGQLEAAPRILDALKRLEYRGYDSAGLTTLSNGKPIRRRAVGKLAALTREVAQHPAPGSAGIGHTRWATHGAPTTANAHPHAAGPVHVVHNGIIENFRELRADLAASGMTCETETDSEVIAQLVARAMASGQSPMEAVNSTIGMLEGAFALAFLFEDHPDLMIAARQGSPLAIGWGDDEMFVGSDALALSPLTSRITYLEEGDRALITRSGVTIWDAALKPVERSDQAISASDAHVDKAGHRHFMAKEIHEQPEVIARVLGRYVEEGRQRIVSPAETVDWVAMDRLLIVGCGTAALAGHVAKYWFEQLAGLPVELDIASEFRYRDPPLTGKEGLIVISQSGETADTLAALRHVRDRVAAPIGVVNVTTSTIARETGLVLPILAGREIGVASTKAFTCQLLVLATTAILAARKRGRIDAVREATLIDALSALPPQMTLALAQTRRIEELGDALSTARDVLYLGRGPLYPLAMEGALKLKEISYIHAEGYAAGELKHGPIALVDDKVPVVVLGPMGDHFDKTASNTAEVMARGGRVIFISDPGGQTRAGPDIWQRIEMPAAEPIAQPILYAVPIQLLAYHTARAKGTDVDQPRNLAKSVTVE